jgi:hypothetical protein
MQPSQQLINPKILQRRATRQRRLTAAVICTAVVSFFGIFAVAAHKNTDMGQWLGYCGFKQRTGLPCPTCGMTTATLAFASGHIGQAFYIQPAGALVCSIMVVAAIFSFITAVFAVDFRFIDAFFSKLKLRYIIAALIVILAAGWAVTLSRALAS